MDLPFGDKRAAVAFLAGRKYLAAGDLSRCALRSKTQKDHDRGKWCSGSDHYLRGHIYFDDVASMPGRFSRPGYIGKPDVISATSRRTCFLSDSDSGSLMTAAISSPIFRISSSFIPRVVKAGVPNLIPDATNGFCVSNGIVFLFTVI